MPGAKYKKKSRFLGLIDLFIKYTFSGPRWNNEVSKAKGRRKYATAFRQY
jgi:hypothetical protein